MSDPAQASPSPHHRDPLGAVVGVDRLSGSRELSSLIRRSRVTPWLSARLARGNLRSSRIWLFAGSPLRPVERRPARWLSWTPRATWRGDLLNLVPDSLAHRVRYLDFGSMDRVPSVNILDPMLFPDREACVDTVVTTFKYLWEYWGGPGLRIYSGTALACSTISTVIPTLPGTRC